MRGEVPPDAEDVASRTNRMLRHRWTLPLLFVALVGLVIGEWLAVSAAGDARSLDCWPSCSRRQDVLRLLGYTVLPGAIICLVIAILFAMRTQLSQHPSRTRRRRAR